MDDMRKSKSIATVIALLIICFVETVVPVFAEETDHFFVRSDSLTCGTHTVVLTSSCVDIEPDSPFCFNQNLIFLDRTLSLTKQVSYNYEYHGGNQAFIASLRCATKNNESYVKLPDL
jgi:hypothetical protein